MFMGLSTHAMPMGRGTQAHGWGGGRLGGGWGGAGGWGSSMVLWYAAFAKDLCTLLLYLSHGGDPSGQTADGGRLITELGIKPPVNLPEKKASAL